MTKLRARVAATYKQISLRAQHETERGGVISINLLPHIPQRDARKGETHGGVPEHK